MKEESIIDKLYFCEEAGYVIDEEIEHKESGVEFDKLSDELEKYFSKEDFFRIEKLAIEYGEARARAAFKRGVRFAVEFMLDATSHNITKLEDNNK